MNFSLVWRVCFMCVGLAVRPLGLISIVRVVKAGGLVMLIGCGVLAEQEHKLLVGFV